MLRTRVILGISIVAAVLGLLFLDVYLVEAEVWGKDYALGLYALAALVVIVAMREFYHMLAQAGRPSHPVIGTLFALLFLAWHFMLRHFQDVMPAVLKNEQLGVGLATIVLLIFVLFLAETRKAELRGGAGPALESIAWTVLGFGYIGLMSIFAIEVRFLPGEVLDGTYMVVLALGVAKATDIGGYTIGRPFGRCKLVPVLSPAKTVEGAIGGLVFGTVFAVIFGWSCLGFVWWQMVIFGLVVSLAAQGGDLAESLIKRACHAKDSGNMGGYGGVLDLIDSVLLSLPVAYLLLVLLTTDWQ